ncbi:UNVERIFIED_CONTAM: two-component system chemotaxis sensor kinase CheA [Acetivibrio alkalicellulosi]
MTHNNNEPMLEMFVFETLQLMDQLEQSLISSEKDSGFDLTINEIFRIMHTVKGSAAMMMYDNISELAHSIEDLFFYLREEKPDKIDTTEITDIVLDGVDFIKNEVSKIQNGFTSNENASGLIKKINDILINIKKLNTSSKSKLDTNYVKENNNDQKFYISSENVNKSKGEYKYEAHLKFAEECEMENIRAFSVIHDLKEVANITYYYPENVIDNDTSCEIIQKEGFKIEFMTDLSLEMVKDRLSHTLFLDKLEVYLKNDDEIEKFETDQIYNNDLYNEKNQIKEVKEIFLDDFEDKHKDNNKPVLNNQISKKTVVPSGKQSVISVNIGKLDMLMDLVGELVISEAMVTQNPDLIGLQLDSFHKAARQLNKITNELQDVVMSIRMVPLSSTFQKMNRIVRDMSKKLNKSVELKILGEETEVDKNIIERISDPLIHIIRNSIDHGIEETSERKEKGKSPLGNLVLEAKNAGGDVWIIIKDDGRGLDKEKILIKARENGLINKPEDELSDDEIYSFIFKPGFSTKEKISEFSGRGVGMDIVVKNIEMVGGTVQVNSAPGEGTTISIKFPLTLAIIDGMTVLVGESRYTIPTISIKESFKIKNESIIEDNNGNLMIMVRGQAYPILKLHKYYNINTKITDIKDGIIVMIENNSRILCVFADALLGEQQVVVKPLPKYIEKAKGIAGCTLLGDGNISLILDVAKIFMTF